MSTDVLVLNTTLEPLNVVAFKRAISLLLNGKAKIVHVRDRDVRAATIAIPLPSVIQMVYYIARGRREVPLSKKAVLIRDEHRCQYCGVTGQKKLTVDHIMPRSRGGGSTWENLVTACMVCNQRKRDRTPDEAGMRLRKKPRKPRFIPWLVISRNTTEADWLTYITLWSVSIDERIG
jgi:5-methylcytosine-specific restriction endonuclease McrA